MHNSAERRFIVTVVTVIISLIAAALLVFLVKYTRDSLYPTNAEGYFKVEYINLDEQYAQATLAADEQISLPTLTRTGYSFMGWYYDENGSLKVEQGETVSCDIKMYALWSINSYTVTAYPNYEATPAANYSLYYDANFSIPSPQRTGYSFVNWYYDEACTQSVNLSLMPAENITIYAKWSINQYSLRTINAWADQTTDSQVVYNSPLTLHDLTGTRTGYTFTGWYTEQTFTNEVVTGTPMPASNLVLYAGWVANEYPLEFITNGGSSIETMVASYESDISALQIPVTVRPGYDFEYWYENLSDDSVPYVFDTMPLDGLTLYAKWIVRTDTEYKIEYYFEDSQGVFVRDNNETEILQGTTDAYRAISPKTFTGYDFDNSNIFNYTEGYILGDGSTVFKFYYCLP